jgi:RNase H-fold protein (predicted Holliday junction resolvase)
VTAPPIGGAVLAVDPGREKCGLALVDAAGVLLEKTVLSLDDLVPRLRRLLEAHPDCRLVVGDRTGSREVRDRIAAAFPGRPVALVPEHRSTERALERWRDVTPPRGWRRLVPRCLRFPREPLDDFAAWVLAEEWVQSETERAEELEDRRLIEAGDRSEAEPGGNVPLAEVKRRLRL